MDFKRTGPDFKPFDPAALAEQLIRGRDRIEAKRKKQIAKIYGALIRGRDRMAKTDYKLPETKNE